MQFDRCPDSQALTWCSSLQLGALLRHGRHRRADALQGGGHIQGRARGQVACPAGPRRGRLPGRWRNLHSREGC